MHVGVQRASHPIRLHLHDLDTPQKDMKHTFLSVIKHSSVEIRSQPCICTGEEESRLCCQRGDLHEHHTIS